MRTAIIIAGGIVLLCVFVAAGWRLGSGPSAAGSAAKVFIAVWLAIAAINTWFGVARAGYSVSEELPVFLVTFAIPALIAAFAAWRFS